MGNPRYEVIWADSAAGDLESLMDFIEMGSPRRAQQVWARIKKRAAMLDHFPERSRVVPELRALGLPMYRELIVYPYRIPFRIQGKTVVVLGVFDGRRDLEEVLFERLTRP